MLVYLDNCCYNRPYDDQQSIRIALETQAKLYIQRLIVEKKIELAFSYVSWYENSVNPYVVKRETIACFFQNATIFLSDLSASKMERAAKKFVAMGLKRKDALHLACAIEMECDYFITTDDSIVKKYRGEKITVANPLLFVGNTEK